KTLKKRLKTSFNSVQISQNSRKKASKRAFVFHKVASWSNKIAAFGYQKSAGFVIAIVVRSSVKSKMSLSVRNVDAFLSVFRLNLNLKFQYTKVANLVLIWAWHDLPHFQMVSFLN